MTKDKFSTSEWKLLLNAPQWVYTALAAAERGSISTRRTEAKALEKFLTGYKTRSPLVKEIIAGQEEADDKVKGSLKDAEKMLGQVGTLLERKVDEAEGDAVRGMLTEAGAAVAEANREALFGDSESSKEEKALALVGTALKATEADKGRRREAAVAAEAKRRAQEAKQAEARAAADRKREEAARAEAKRKADEAEAKKKAAAAEAETKRLVQEAEDKRKAAAAAAERKAAEAETKRLVQEAEDKRKAAAAEAKKKAAEAEAKKEAAEAEAQKAAEAADAEAETMRIYVVKPGDTLSGISKEVYGDAGRWREIFKANRDRIKKANLIRPGWKLRIPD